MEISDVGGFLGRFGAGVGRGLANVATGGVYMQEKERQQSLQQTAQERQQMAQVLQSDQPNNVKAAMLSRFSIPEAQEYVKQLMKPTELPASVQEFQAMQSMPEEQRQQFQQFKNPVAQITPYQQQQLELERQKLQGSTEYQSAMAQNQARELQLKAQQLQAAGRTQEAAAVNAQAEQAIAQMPQRKLSATEQKEFYEADEKATAATGVVGAIDAALQLNDKAFSGVTADARAWANRLPIIGGFIPDEGAYATTDLNNIILSQALESLKVTFGAAPTEGERKILVDLQASVDKLPAERASILQRAKDAALRRQKDAQNKMQGITTGGIYNQGLGGQQGAGPAAQQQAVPLQGLTALPQGFKDLGNGMAQGPDGAQYKVQRD